MFLLDEAKICRGLAVDFEGKAEGSFLMKAAQAFEELAVPTGRSRRAPRDSIRLF